MNNRQKDFDICLFVIGMEYAKYRDVIITIQYGSVILRRENKIVELVSSLHGERIQHLLIPASINKFDNDLIKVWIPYSLINNSDSIYDFLDYILNPLANPKGIATISLSRKIVLVLNKTKEVYLDEYFCLQESRKFQIFHILQKKNRYELKIIVGEKEPFSQIINIQIRDGKGNEDL